MSVVRIMTMGLLAALLTQGVAVPQATPQQIKIQGYLSDIGGGPAVPANGSHMMTFELYDAALGGALKASVGPIQVPVTDGIYSAELPFTETAFDGTDRYIEITVNGETLLPRVRLVSLPFAYVADKLDGLDAADLDETAEIATLESDIGAVDDRIDAHEQAADPHPYVQEAFTIHSAPGGTDPMADAAADTLSYVATAPVTISGDAGADSLTFGVAPATTTTLGVCELAAAGESAPNVVVQGNDPRLVPASLTWNVVPASCTSDPNGGSLTIDGGNQIVCSSDDSGPAPADISAVGDCSSGACFDGTAGGNSLVFEGQIQDGFETVLTVEEPGADYVLELPAKTGTLAALEKTGGPGGGNETLVLAGEDADSQIGAYGTCSDNPTLDWFGIPQETDRYTCQTDQDCTAGTCGGTDLLVLNPGRCAEDDRNACLEVELNDSPAVEDCVTAGTTCTMGERGNYYMYLNLPDGPQPGLGIRQGPGSISALDIMSSGHKALRVFSPGLDRPHSWVDAGGRWATVTGVRISGQTAIDGLGQVKTGDQAEVYATNGNWSQPMLDVFSDVLGANALFRTNLHVAAKDRTFNVGFLNRLGRCEDGVTPCNCKPNSADNYPAPLCEPCLGIPDLNNDGRLEECYAVFGLMVGEESELMWSDTIKGPIHRGTCSIAGSECVEDWQCPVGETCDLHPDCVCPGGVHCGTSSCKTQPPADTKLLRDGFGRLMLEGQLKTDGKIIRIDEDVPPGSDPVGGIFASALYDYHAGAGFGDNPVVGVWGEAGTRGEMPSAAQNWDSVAGVKGVAKLQGDSASSIPSVSGLEAEVRYGSSDGGSNTTIGSGSGLVVRSPDPEGAGVSVANHWGINIEDQNCADSHSECAALRIASQSNGSADQSKEAAIYVASPTWDQGAIRLDDLYLWNDSSANTLRYSQGPPTGRTSGARINNVTDTGASMGHVMWFDAGDPSFDSGTEVCGKRGLACQYVQEQGGTRRYPRLTTSPGGSNPDPSACATPQTASSGILWIAYCGNDID